MSRVIRAQILEAIIGLIITALISRLGEEAALLGISGTSLVMALTGLLADSGKIIIAVLALLFPFVSTTALETALGKPLSAIVDKDSGDEGTTIENVYDKYNGGREGDSRPDTDPPKVDANARAAVDPSSLTLKCFGKDCRGEVTIRSTGTSKLRLTWTEFTGSDAKAWHYSDDCDHESIDPGESCSFRVWADETDGPDATLIVHDNSPNPASRVAVTVDPGTTTNPRPEREGTVNLTASSGIEPAVCSALDGTLTVQAYDGPVNWTAVLDPSATGVTVTPASGALAEGESQTVAIRGSYTGAGFGLSIKNANGSGDVRIVC